MNPDASSDGPVEQFVGAFLRNDGTNFGVLRQVLIWVFAVGFLTASAFLVATWIGRIREARRWRDRARTPRRSRPAH